MEKGELILYEKGVSISLPEIPNSYSVNASKEKVISFIYDGMQTKIYDVPLGVEYEIILDRPPKTNTLSFSLNLMDCIAYFQPPLDEELTDIPKEDFVNATHHVDSKGTILKYRPVNVVNSYAVYDKYTGLKVLHIYRILTRDASGKETWSDMEIKDTELLISIDQKFLDNAEYPVVIDPTFGKTTLGASQSREFLRMQAAVRGAPISSGTVKNISLGLPQWQDFNARVAIYADSSGEPAALLTESADTDVINGATSWFVIDVPDIAVTSGTYYWLAIQQSSTTPGNILLYDSVSNGGRYITWTYGAFANPFGTGSIDNIQISIYASYDVASGTNYEVAVSKTLNLVTDVTVAWTSNVGSSKNLMTSWIVSEAWSALVPTSLTMLFAPSIGIAWNAVVSPVLGLISTFITSTQWNALVGLSGSIVSSVVVAASLGVEIIVGVIVSMLFSFGISVSVISAYEMVGIMAFILAVCALVLVVTKK